MKIEPWSPGGKSSVRAKTEGHWSRGSGLQCGAHFIFHRRWLWLQRPAVRLRKQKQVSAQTLFVHGGLITQGPDALAEGFWTQWRQEQLPRGVVREVP